MAKDLSRRKFLKLMAGAGTIGMTVALTSGGENILTAKGEPPGGDGWIPDQYNGKGDFSLNLKGRVAISYENPAIMRDDQKCVLCGQCIEACQNVMAVYGNYPLPLKQEIACIHCGQCAMYCPSGAITERRIIEDVLAAIEDGS